MRTNLIENRQIRVFISSTFQDMQDEREYLMRHTFPVLKQLAAKRDVALTELDLRWGITEEEAETGKVVEICLREIENSIPFFIGIIGNRYGWVPERKDIGSNVTDRFPNVKDYIEKHLSVTDMEMQFGVLNRKEDMHAFFYIKEQEEAQDNPEMLNRLKDAVRASRYPDSTYASPEDLGEQVKEAFIKLLDDIFPEKELSEVEKEVVMQRAFRNSLCRNYIRDEHNFDAIDKWLEYSDSPQFVITGASGMGKSAFIANWIKEKEQTEGFPYHIVYHFVGNGSNEGSHRHIAHVLAESIQATYGFEKNRNSNDELADMFSKVSFKGDRPLLIVLDAVNQISDVENSNRLSWMPNPQKNVRILFSTLEDDKTINVFRNRKYPIFTLLPLNLVRRRQLVKKYLCSYGKKLKDEQITRIITDTQCENTLVLKTLLDELVNFGIFERLDERINYFLRPNTVEQFYQTLLESYEMEFPFTEHVLSLIALSRSGLSEDELLHITKLSPLHWSQFYCSFYNHLTVIAGLITFGHTYIRSAVETRYALNEESEKNDALREEIISLYDGQTTTRALHERPHQYFALNDDVRLHDILMDIDVFMHLFHTEKNNLVRYWTRLKDKYSIEDYVPLAEVCKNKGEALNSLSIFCRNSVVVPELSSKLAKLAFDYMEKDEDKADALVHLGLSEDLLGHHTKALEYNLKALEIFQRVFGDRHPETGATYACIGQTYASLDDNRKALEYMLKALQILQKSFGYRNEATSTIINNLGIIYGRLGDNKKSLEYALKSLEIKQEISGDKHPDTATSLNNIGATYEDLGDHGKALEYKLKALEIRLDFYGYMHPDTAISLTNVGYTYGKLGDHNKRLECELKALEIFQTIFGNRNQHTASSYECVGIAYSALGDHLKALDYHLKALEIFQDIFDDEHKDIVQSLTYVADSYGALDDHQKALDYHIKALEIHQKLNGNEHHNAFEYLRNVAFSYEALNNHQKSLEYHLEALRLCKKNFGERNKETATSFSLVGITYGELGDYRKGLEYLLKALEVNRIVFGEMHDITATYFKNAGVAYSKLGEYQKALEHHQKALEIRKVIIGEKHPDTISSFSHVFSAYYSLGNYRKALEYGLKDLEIRLEVFGEKHPETITTFCNVSSAYRQLDDYVNALELELKTLEIRQETLGDKHPDTAESFNNVGYTYGMLDDNHKSLEFHLRALKIRQEILGDSHLDTATSFYNVGAEYHDINDNRKALEYLQKALEIYQSVCGNANSYTIKTLLYIGNTLNELGEREVALTYYFKHLQATIDLVGDKHVDTACAYNNIGLTYYYLCDLKNALLYDQKALKVRQDIYGDLHIDTMMSYDNVGADFRELGDYKKALQYIIKARDIAKELDDGEYVALYTNRLALTYKTAGDIANAIAHYLQASELYAQLGDEKEADENKKSAEELQVVLPSPPPHVPKFLKYIKDKFTWFS